VPLAQYREPMAQPCVRSGDRVRAGELIAKPVEQGAVAAHAPVGAVVTDVVEVNTPYRDGVRAVALRPQADQPEVVPAGPGAMEPGNRQELLAAVSAAGVYLREPWPALDAQSPAWLIVSGLETEPAQAPVTQALAERPQDVVAAAGWLASLLEVRQACIVADRRRRPGWPGLRRALQGAQIRLVNRPSLYPGTMAPLLVKGVTGWEIPCGARAADVGVFVLDARSLLDLRDAVRHRRPQTTVPIFATGDSVDRPGHYRLPLGTTVERLAERVGLRGACSRVVVDSLMSGPAVREAGTVLTKHSRAVLFLPEGSRVEHPPLGCIRCGLCQEHCPVGLDTRALLDLAERQQFDRASRYAPAACLDCGLCDYVCPSALPLMRAVQRSRSHARVA
jgi:electron transport complex protein RnfC